MIATIKTLTKLRAVATGCVIALFCAACAHEPVITTPANVALSDHQPAVGYIVQSTSVEAAAAAVGDVGGEVTHELGIIRAVGAKLLPVQADALRSRDDVRRVFEDAPVKTSSLCNVAAGATVFDDGKFFWTISNTGSSTVTIGALSIAFPSVNGALKKIKLDSREGWGVKAQPPYVQIAAPAGAGSERRVHVRVRQQHRLERGQLHDLR